MLGVSGQFTLDGTYGFRARVTWSETYDISQNTSQFSITALEILKTQPYYTALMFLDGDITVNGTPVVTFVGSAASHIVTTTGAWETVCSQKPSVYPDAPWSIAVPHGADGAASVTVRLGFKAYSSTAGSASGWGVFASEDIALSRIPRASSVSAPAGVIGAAVPVTISRVTPEATHTLTYSFGSASGVIASQTALTNLSWTPAMALCSQLPAAESGSCTLTCKTYFGGVLTGTATCTLSLAVPASVGLTLQNGWAALTYHNADSPAGAITGFVQGMSRARAIIDSTKIDTSTARGATVLSYSVEIGAEKVTQSPYITSVITASGTIPAAVTVTDTRGRVKRWTTNLTVMPCAAPTLSGVTLCRCTASGVPDPDGEYLAAEATAGVSPLGGQNTPTLTAAWCVRGGEYGAETTLQSGMRSVLGGGMIEAHCTYSARITLTDSLGQTAAYECDIPTASVAFHLREGGAGAAFGKYAEADNELELPASWKLKIGSTALTESALAALLELIR